jgi:hypothetical protein
VRYAESLDMSGPSARGALLVRHWRQLAIGAAFMAILSGHRALQGGGFDPVVALPILIVLSFATSTMLERTLKAAKGAPADRRALIAYLPLGSASLALFFAYASADRVLRAGSLNTFYDAAAALLGLLLVSVVIEARRLAAHDQWLRVLRGWWVLFIVVGILGALWGLTPGQPMSSQANDYAWVWAGLAGAIAALVVVMWKDPQRQHSDTGDANSAGIDGRF